MSALSPHAAAEGRARDEGYTLVETVVALALFLVVLLPAASALVYLAGKPDVRHRMEALERAQNALEEAVSEAPETWANGEEKEGPWRVRREVRREGRLAVVTVTVSRGDDGDPLATLTTARFVPPDSVPPE